MAERTPEQIETFCAAAQNYWASQGSRRTQVRDVLCRVIAAEADPFTAEELLAKARKVDRLISYASVYRTLASLVESGLLREAPGAREHRCYTLASAPGGGMTHIICTDCEQVVPLADECLPLREGFLAKQQGFIPKKMTLRIEASCEELRRSGVCERRKRKP
jgi:Fe2+/Zn2+ uptake regulation proteins